MGPSLCSGWQALFSNSPFYFGNLPILRQISHETSNKLPSFSLVVYFNSQSG